jgi:hypothetical protein
VLALGVGSLLGLVERNLNELSLVVVVSFNAKYLYRYFISARAVGFRQVIVAEKSS